MSFAEEGLLAELSQRLDVMRVQEVNHYTVPDYLAADWQQRLNDASELGSNDTNDGVDSSLSFSDVVSSSQINELWREKICEWYYQIVDHYGTKRCLCSCCMQIFVSTRCSSSVFSTIGSSFTSSHLFSMRRIQPRDRVRIDVIPRSLSCNPLSQSSHLPTRRYDCALHCHQAL